MTHIINMYGGPGAGKSTAAADVFLRAKRAGLNVELVRECAKDWAWEGRAISSFEQLYLTGEQIRRESRLFDRADLVVTDCPVAVGAFYGKLYCEPVLWQGLLAMTRGYYGLCAERGHTHHHLFLGRSKPYQEAGRYQTEAQARAIDVALEAMLWDDFGFQLRGTTSGGADIQRFFDELGTSGVPA